jgi:hypothetical protein
VVKIISPLTHNVRFTDIFTSEAVKQAWKQSEITERKKGGYSKKAFFLRDFTITKYIFFLYHEKSYKYVKIN